ncbi:collagen alpha-1(I) chain-like [Acomys russatus]|uniref:collagen alpha-1(I) chain-like n=1 Tax=Acomys russatus TaxID=60746 RepID=UPI0021E1D846|nr:collagen alpha-1(I) chain-like [Acomys russatus]
MAPRTPGIACVCACLCWSGGPFTVRCRDRDRSACLPAVPPGPSAAGAASAPAGRRAGGYVWSLGGRVCPVRHACPVRQTAQQSDRERQTHRGRSCLQSRRSAGRRAGRRAGGRAGAGGSLCSPRVRSERATEPSTGQEQRNQLSRRRPGPSPLQPVPVPRPGSGPLSCQTRRVPVHFSAPARPVPLGTSSGQEAELHLPRRHLQARPPARPPPAARRPPPTAAAASVPRASGRAPNRPACACASGGPLTHGCRDRDPVCPSVCLPCRPVRPCRGRRLLPCGDAVAAAAAVPAPAGVPPASEEPHGKVTRVGRPRLPSRVRPGSGPPSCQIRRVPGDSSAPARPVPLAASSGQKAEPHPMPPRPAVGRADWPAGEAMVISPGPCGLMGKSPSRKRRSVEEARAGQERQLRRLQRAPHPEPEPARGPTEPGSRRASGPPEQRGPLCPGGPGRGRAGDGGGPGGDSSRQGSRSRIPKRRLRGRPGRLPPQIPGLTGREGPSAPEAKGGEREGRRRPRGERDPAGAGYSRAEASAEPLAVTPPGLPGQRGPLCSGEPGEGVMGRRFPGKARPPDPSDVTSGRPLTPRRHVRDGPRNVTSGAGSVTSDPRPRDVTSSLPGLRACGGAAASSLPVSSGSAPLRGQKAELQPPANSASVPVQRPPTAPPETAGAGNFGSALTGVPPTLGHKEQNRHKTFRAASRGPAPRFSRSGSHGQLPALTALRRHPAAGSRNRARHRELPGDRARYRDPPGAGRRARPCPPAAWRRPRVSRFPHPPSGRETGSLRAAAGVETTAAAAAAAVAMLDARSPSRWDVRSLNGPRIAPARSESPPSRPPASPRSPASAAAAWTAWSEAAAGSAAAAAAAAMLDARSPSRWDVRSLSGPTIAPARSESPPSRPPASPRSPASAAAAAWTAWSEAAAGPTTAAAAGAILAGRSLLSQTVSVVSLYLESLRDHGDTIRRPPCGPRPRRRRGPLGLEPAKPRRRRRRTAAAAMMASEPRPAGPRLQPHVSVASRPGSRSGPLGVTAIRSAGLHAAPAEAAARADGIRTGQASACVPGSRPGRHVARHAVSSFVNF